MSPLAYPFRRSFHALAFALALGLIIHDAPAVTYDIRAKTGDKISAVLYVGNGVYQVGSARQGSFGAPSINDKGSVAYANIISGVGITAFTNNTVSVRKKGKKKPSVIAVQAGQIISDSFLPSFRYPTYGALGTATMYRISRNVQINNRNEVGFAGQLTFFKATDQLEKGIVTKTTYTYVDTQVYGILQPFGAAYTSVGLSNFQDYDATILAKPISLNSQSATVIGALIRITDTKSVPGFVFSSPYDGGTIATLESPAIGLPYFAQYTSFSEPIITDKNVTFVVADLNDDGNAFDGIWQGNNPNLQPVVVKGAQVASGGKLTSFDGVTGPSRNGKYCAFTANLTTGRGVYRVNVDGNNLVEIATVGGAAPSATGGTAGNFQTLDLAGSSNAGQVAVLGGIAGSNNNTLSGIWLSDKSGKKLSLVVIEGQTILVGKKKKTINKLAFNPNSGINRKGQVVFTASFSDRTSAVIAAKL